MVDKFTFKKHPKQTGLAAIAEPHSFVDIKINKKLVGSIKPPSRFGKKVWEAMFRVVNEDETANCPWRWATLKFKSNTEAEMREWITNNAETIQTKLNLMLTED